MATIELTPKTINKKTINKKNNKPLIIAAVLSCAQPYFFATSEAGNNTLKRDEAQSVEAND